MKEENNITNDSKPLADRMRPDSLGEFLGNNDVIGEGKMLRQAIENDSLPSLIFWGPPGSGKTTLANIIANQTNSEFIQISAVTSGLKDLRTVISGAKANSIEGRSTILFIDEIHRWNKKQQDALLPHVEKGLVTLIGATTENPSFEVRGALLSRCRVFILEPMSRGNIEALIERAIRDKKKGLGGKGIKIDGESRKLLSEMSNGDARTALNILEFAGKSSRRIRAETIKEAFQKSHLFYDKNGEEHYNIISALHKAMRGSDPNAALYWLARMLKAGEDPLYIARRLVRFASEDIGLKNSRALEQSVAAYHACHFLGMPECDTVLAQAVVYMAKCEKSNELYKSYKKAEQDVEKYGNLPVPLHLRNAPTGLMKDLGYGRGYKYSPDHGYKEKQDYLPDEIKHKIYIN